MHVYACSFDKIMLDSFAYQCLAFPDALNDSLCISATWQIIITYSFGFFVLSSCADMRHSWCHQMRTGIFRSHYALSLLIFTYRPSDFVNPNFGHLYSVRCTRLHPTLHAKTEANVIMKIWKWNKLKWALICVFKTNN